MKKEMTTQEEIVLLVKHAELLQGQAQKAQEQVAEQKRLIADYATQIQSAVRNLERDAKQQLDKAVYDAKADVKSALKEHGKLYIMSLLITMTACSVLGGAHYWYWKRAVTHAQTEAWAAKQSTLMYRAESNNFNLSTCEGKACIEVDDSKKYGSAQERFYIIKKR